MRRNHNSRKELNAVSTDKSVTAARSQTQVLLQVKDGVREKNNSLEIFDDITSTKDHEALHQQEHLHEEQMAQQQWEANRVETTRLAVQTLTQMNGEFRRVKHDAPAEMDKLNRIQMQEFAIKAGRQCSKTQLCPGSMRRTLTT